MLRLLPVALLVVVALVQLVLAHTASLSPWSGGGFGMFSSLDHGSQRHLHAFIVRPGLRREIVPPPELTSEIARARALPSEAGLRRIAIALADSPTPDHGRPTAVQIQVWSTRFDPQTLAPSSSILKEFLLPLDGDD
jgi:hypothetical protein